MYRSKCRNVLIVIFIVFLGGKTVLHLQRSVPNFMIVAPKTVQERCVTIFLRHLNISHLFPEDLKRLPQNAIIREFLPSYPLEKLPKDCRALLEPLHVNQMQRTQSELSCYLRIPYDSQSRTVIRHYLKRLVHTFAHQKIDLILTGGSALGSWRHHGIIPYDDDVDFQIRSEDKVRVKALLIKLCHGRVDCRFRDTEHEMGHWKLDIGCSKRKNMKNADPLFCMLQIDIFFLRIEGNQIKTPEKPFLYNKSDIYPLIDRPFEGLIFKSINNLKEFSRKTYGSSNINECRSYEHGVKEIDRCPQERIDCRLLEPFRPFIRSVADRRGGAVEFLIHQRKIVSVFYNPKAKTTF